MLTMFILYSVEQPNSKKAYTKEEEEELEQFFKLSTRSVAPTIAEIEKFMEESRCCRGRNIRSLKNKTYYTVNCNKK